MTQELKNVIFEFVVKRTDYAEGIAEQNEAVKALRTKASDSINALERILTKEQLEFLDDLLSTKNEIVTYQMENAYKTGFCDCLNINKEWRGI